MATYTSFQWGNYNFGMLRNATASMILVWFKYILFLTEHDKGLHATCLFNILVVPSHFPMESTHKAAVVSQEPKTKRKILLDGYQWLLPREYNGYPDSTLHK